MGDYLCRGVDGNRDGVLRADYFPWVGGTSLVPGNFPDIRSPGADAGQSMLVGASLALLCNLIARLPGFEGALPVNSVTALVGAPVVASVLFRKRKRRDAVEF